MRRQKVIPRSNREKRSYKRALRALNDMRKGASLSRAARENGVTRRTIKKYAGSALVQDRPGGYIRVTQSDSLLRPLQIPGKHGPVEIDVGSRTAKKAAKYKADVNRALAGDPKALAKWRGKKIAGVELITDVKVLAEQADKGLLPYALYRSLSGARA